MADFTVIKATEAPKPSKQAGRLVARQREYEGYVAGVPAGRVGKLVPSPGESPRGIALRISRAAKRLNKTVETWVADGIVYFTVS